MLGRHGRGSEFCASDQLSSSHLGSELGLRPGVMSLFQIPQVGVESEIPGPSFVAFQAGGVAARTQWYLYGTPVLQATSFLLKRNRDLQSAGSLLK